MCGFFISKCANENRVKFQRKFPFQKMPFKFVTTVRSIKIFPVNNNNNEKDEIDPFAHKFSFTKCQKLQVRFNPDRGIYVILKNYYIIL